MEDFLRVMQALNDRSRLEILIFLKAQEDMLCVCDLQHSLNMIQSRLSRHLKILKEAGFLEFVRKGTWAYYGIKKDLRPLCASLPQELDHLQIDIPPLVRISCKISQ